MGWRGRGGRALLTRLRATYKHNGHIYISKGPTYKSRDSTYKILREQCPYIQEGPTNKAMALITRAMTLITRETQKSFMCDDDSIKLRFDTWNFNLIVWRTRSNCFQDQMYIKKHSNTLKATPEAVRKICNPYCTQAWQWLSLEWHVLAPFPRCQLWTLHTLACRCLFVRFLVLISPFLPTIQHLSA